MILRINCGSVSLLNEHSYGRGSTLSFITQIGFILLFTFAFLTIYQYEFTQVVINFYPRKITTQMANYFFIDDYYSVNNYDNSFSRDKPNANTKTKDTCFHRM